MEGTPPEPWVFVTEALCQQFLQGINRFNGGFGWCNGTTDQALCWPSAPPGETIMQLCPPMLGIDATKSARKTCGPNGRWAGRGNVADLDPSGYTDYEPCYTEETRLLMNRFYGDDGIPVDEKHGVLPRCKAIEMSGFPLSLVCVLISLFIFRYFRSTGFFIIFGGDFMILGVGSCARIPPLVFTVLTSKIGGEVQSLRCARTTIHVHLFSAIVIMTASKVIELADQYSSGYVLNPNVEGGIREVRPLCEILVSLVEYGRTAMFFWMFLEGLYMHNVVAWKVFEGSKPNFKLYCLIGWGIPAALVACWAPVIEFVWLREQMLSRNGSFGTTNKCWYPNAESSYYFILEVPRFFVIAINLIFLINIIRVLLTKLRDSHQSDTVQIRKAVKATIVLAPLLGVTHLIVLTQPRGEKVPFALLASYLYISHFLRAFEGFFVAMVYCFLNGEVQAAIKATCQRRALVRETKRNADRRISSSASSPFLVRSSQFKAAKPLQRVDNASANGTKSMFRFLPGLKAKSNADKNSYLSVSSLTESSRTNSSSRTPFDGAIQEEPEENTTGI